MHTWWAKGALDLIENSYGLSFKDGKTTAKDIEVRFYYADDGYMATARGLTIASDHTAGRLVLNINMKNCEPDYLDDKKGVAMHGTLLDGMFVHELVHATIAATIPYFTEMPHLFVESLP